MSKTFLIGSCEPFSGKSALVLGIARNLIASNHLVRFGKPLATSLELNVSDRGDIQDMIDDDVKFVGETLKLSAENLIPSIQFLAASTASKRIKENILDPGIKFNEFKLSLNSPGEVINILEAIRFFNCKCKFYNASSSECFGDTGKYPANEETPFRPKSPYGVAKASAYWQVANYRESYGLFACSGIMFNHESILRPTRFVTRKICQSAAKIALGKESILKLGNLTIKRDWGWAPEYVEAMWKMLQEKEPEDYVIATGRIYGLNDFVREAFSSFNLDWEKHVVIQDALKRPSEIKSGYGSPIKAKTKLNWSAKTFMPEIASIMAIEEFNMLKENN